MIRIACQRALMRSPSRLNPTCSLHSMCERVFHIYTLSASFLIYIYILFYFGSLTIRELLYGLFIEQSISSQIGEVGRYRFVVTCFTVRQEAETCLRGLW